MSKKCCQIIPCVFSVLWIAWSVSEMGHSVDMVYVPRDVSGRND